MRMKKQLCFFLLLFTSAALSVTAFADQNGPRRPQPKRQQHARRSNHQGRQGQFQQQFRPQRRRDPRNRFQRSQREYSRRQPQRRQDRPPQRDRVRGWSGSRGYWRGRPYWHGNIRQFHDRDYSRWRRGYWHHGWYGGRWGWWWIVGGIWYYYPAPIYPYPNPYIPGIGVIINQAPSEYQQPSVTPAPPSEAPVQYWYRCNEPKGYYPYVSECPGGWIKVPATPPSGNGAPPRH